MMPVAGKHPDNLLDGFVGNYAGGLTTNRLHQSDTHLPAYRYARIRGQNTGSGLVFCIILHCHIILLRG